VSSPATVNQPVDPRRRSAESGLDAPPHKVREERARPALGVPIGDYRRMNDGQTD